MKRLFVTPAGLMQQVKRCESGIPASLWGEFNLFYFAYRPYDPVWPSGTGLFAAKIKQVDGQWVLA